MAAHFGPKIIKDNRQKVTQKPDLSKLTDFAQKLRFAGWRPTRQRVATAVLLFDGRHSQVTVETLTEQISDAGLQVSLGTLCNTLNKFIDADLLSHVVMHNQ
mgnify:FL=1